MNGTYIILFYMMISKMELLSLGLGLRDIKIYFINRPSIHKSDALPIYLKRLKMILSVASRLSLCIQKTQASSESSRRRQNTWEQGRVYIGQMHFESISRGKSDLRVASPCAQRKPLYPNSRGAMGQFPETLDHVTAPTLMLRNPGDGHLEEAEFDLLVQI